MVVEDLIKPKTRDIQRRAIHNYIYFTFNAPYRWIEKCFKGTGLTEHLEEKLTDLDGDINSFYCELDTSLQNKMLNWILENYQS